MATEVQPYNIQLLSLACRDRLIFINVSWHGPTVDFRRSSKIELLLSLKLEERWRPVKICGAIEYTMDAEPFVVSLFNYNFSKLSNACHLYKLKSKTNLEIVSHDLLSVEWKFDQWQMMRQYLKITHQWRQFIASMPLWNDHAIVLQIWCVEYQNNASYCTPGEYSPLS